MQNNLDTVAQFDIYEVASHFVANQELIRKALPLTTKHLEGQKKVDLAEYFRNMESVLRGDNA